MCKKAKKNKKCKAAWAAGYARGWQYLILDERRMGN
jgi:hypothetical protein